MPALVELESAFADAWSDPGFVADYRRWLTGLAGRPTPLYHAPRLSAELGMRVLLKRETWRTPEPTRSTTPSVSAC